MRTKCKHCDHFVEVNTVSGGGISDLVHLDNGDQSYDHEPEAGESKTDEIWLQGDPNLFRTYPDGEIGPNSVYHSQRGKLGDYKDAEVLFLDNDGKIVQWFAIDNKSLNIGETPEQYGIEWMSEIEKSRVGINKKFVIINGVAIPIKSESIVGSDDTHWPTDAQDKDMPLGSVVYQIQ